MQNHKLLPSVAILYLVCVVAIIGWPPVMLIFLLFVNITHNTLYTYYFY